MFDFVVGDAVETSSGSLANTLDLTVVSSSDQFFSPGFQLDDLVLVSNDQLVFSDEFAETPSGRSNTLNFDGALSRLQ